MSLPPVDSHLEPTLDRVQLAADEELHKPYVPPSTELTELTPGAIVLGIVLGLIFAASSVYLALKVGLTVSASIPIAVLSITIFRYFSRAFGMKPATILQNNIVQTTGSAGESIAAGVVFTLPALLLLGYNLPWPKVAAIAFVGGLLGVLMMIPLRKSLIVKEHRNLKYPEGTACAEVLIVGEEGGIQARTVFMGFGLGAAYKLCNTGFKFWRDTVAHTFTTVAAGRPQLLGEIQAEISPELTGVGYIIGPKVAGYLFAGGVLSFFVLIPAIKLFGAGLTSPMFPATKLISEMDAGTVRSQYIYYIGAGAVTTAGLISLFRALPTILSAMLGSFKGFRGGGAVVDAPLRTQRDLPMWIVAVGTVILAILMIVAPQIHINVLGAILAIFFAFLFVTVSSRITGQIGASANPISGMTIATVLLTSLVFLAVGWTGIEHRVLALSIGGVVCVAAAVAGATSQDLKTGYLVGATPARQQIGLVFGVVTSAVLIGFIIQFLNEASTTIVARQYAGVVIPSSQFDNETRTTLKDGTTYRVGHLYEQTGQAPAGKYLVDQSGAIKYLVDPGIGGKEETDYTGRKIKKLDSPKSQIMALVVDGILTRKLPWGLVLIGAFLAIAMEILGVPSLPIAVGVYLPIATSATIFMGGMVRLLIERRMSQERRNSAEADSGPGVLFASGLIAGGALMNVAVQALVAKELDRPLTQVGAALGPVAESQILSTLFYILFLAVPLYLIAKRQNSMNSHVT